MGFRGTPLDRCRYRTHSKELKYGEEMKGIIQQSIRLMRQNPVQAAIVVTGTAVTIAFVMIVVMNYHLRVAPGGSEPARSHTMYINPGVLHRADGTNVQRGLGKLPYERLLGGLPGVDKATWYGSLGNPVCCLTADDDRMRLYVREVGEGWFDFFDYDILAGRAFSAEENHDGAREAMVSRSAASRLSKSAPEDLVGREIMVDFKPLKVTGIYDDVSPLYQSAYGDVLIPFDYYSDENYLDGLYGNRIPLLQLSEGTAPESVMAEIGRRETIFNNEGREYVYHFEKFYDHVGYSFFRDTMINPNLVNGLLVAVLLIVPAVGMGGLINSQMQSRASEIAIRKAYGAPNHAIIGQLFKETLVGTLAGAVLGYLIAWCVLSLGGAWIFGDIRGGGVDVTEALMSRPALWGYLLAACLVFTTLATVIPAWLSTRHNIADTLKGGEK